MPWGSVIASVAGNVLSSAMGSDAAENAANVQADAAAAGIEEQRRQYEQNRKDFEPYRKSGVLANQRLTSLLGLNGNQAKDNADFASRIRSAFPEWQGTGVEISDEDLVKSFLRQAPNMIAVGKGDGGYTLSDPTSETIRNLIDQAPGADSGTVAGMGAGSLLRKFTSADLEADPVYRSGLQFGLDQGTKGINARALATGNFDSGATLKALTRYGNDYGSTKANEARNRFVSDQDSIYNRLMGMSNGGQSATAQVASAGTNMANNVASLTGDAANARSAGIVGGANAWGSGLTNAANSYMNSTILNKLLNRNSTGTLSRVPSGVGGWLNPDAMEF